MDFHSLATRVLSTLNSSHHLEYYFHVVVIVNYARQHWNTPGASSSSVASAAIAQAQWSMVRWNMVEHLNRDALCNQDALQPLFHCPSVYLHFTPKNQGTLLSVTPLGSVIITPNWNDTLCNQDTLACPSVRRIETESGACKIIIFLSKGQRSQKLTTPFVAKGIYLTQASCRTWLTPLTEW